MARAEPSRVLAAQRLEPPMEPTPPAAASPHLVAARPLCALSATRGGAAHLAPFSRREKARRENQEFKTDGPFGPTGSTAAPLLAAEDLGPVDHVRRLDALVGAVGPDFLIVCTLWCLQGYCIRGRRRLKVTARSCYCLLAKPVEQVDTGRPEAFQIELIACRKNGPKEREFFR